MNLFALKFSLPAIALLGAATFILKAPKEPSKNPNLSKDLPITLSTRTTAHPQAPASSNLSDADLLAHFPSRDPNSGITFSFIHPDSKNQTHLFQRELGKRFQEEAIDILIEHKGRQVFTPGLITAVSQAIIGWMEVDREGALEAMAEFFPSGSTAIVAWKGKISTMMG